ncbi:DUF6265 family protein [bacterium]|nr:DUF6265 family protein [bacterium]
MAFLVLFLFVTTASASNLTSFEKLSGCWENRDSAEIYEEVWMRPAGDMMLGMSRTLKNGKAVTFEFIQLQSREDGTFYIASPSKQDRTEFKLTSFNDNIGVFENPSHDFPQKVVYKFDSADSLKVWIEGTRNGKSRKIEFPMTRVKCPGGK